MNVKDVTIRFPQEMLDKIAYVADYEGRSVNSHVLVLVRQNIADFEKIHGKIEGDIGPDVNVKPPRKN
ncbi:Arc family DNA-binding protein [Anaerotignum sp.]|uniref:Arc family DNA-binding protein n=1 Tax=Anaerotignum sp. TaxID=2039241 RepID=UPI0027150623|nr:Arc family DNA-binding protein [Anaerotignum sp.]